MTHPKAYRSFVWLAVALILISTCLLVYTRWGQRGEQRIRLQDASENEAFYLTQVRSSDVFNLARQPGAKLTIVNVWATWCGPCQEEMPELLKFKKAYAAKGVRLVLVSANEFGEAQEALRFLSSVGVDFPTFILHEKESAGSFVQGMKPDWAGGLPATFALDTEGKIKKFWIGQSTFTDLVTKVEPLLTP